MRPLGHYRARSLLAAATLTLCAACPPPRTALTVTYIADEGFMIQSGADKVLVDALFRGETITFCDLPPDGVLAQIERGHPPFDNIDLLLVTHWHWDHFDARSVSRFLKK